MKILFVASEVKGILKVGGIADVISALTKKLKKIGHDVRIVIPFYQPMKEQKIEISEKISGIKVNIGQDTEEINILKTNLPGTDIPVYLLENDKYLSNNGIYLDAKDFSYLTRFLFFSQATLEIFKAINWQPDIIHAHDWQAGLVPLLLKIRKSKIKTVFTIHNLLIQGRWNYQRTLEFLGLKGDEISTLAEKTTGVYGDDFNVMQQAILAADLITTVSPSYAREIKTKLYYARGLQKEIRERKKDIYGILNGLDIKTFDPATDPFIKFHYSAKEISKKLLNKAWLQKKCGFTLSKVVPLIGVVSRLDVQKGVDLVYKVVEQIVAEGCQLVLLGTGQKKYETMLHRAAQKYPQNVKSFIKFDAELAQQIYAGVDIFLMPSKFEPCGLCQLIAMRYGTIPVVRATGGLRDTVKNVKLRETLFGLKKRIEGTGFVFREYEPRRFLATINRALAIYFQPKLWRRLQLAAMNQDLSWDRSAQEYLGLYEKLVTK